jgi:NAD(P)-dependent dehydrogenase (short-subunit alcohol dehydrogenase family)
MIKTSAVEIQAFKRALTGRVALVTGGASGQGRAIALALGKAGAAVAIGSRLRRNGRADDGMDTHWPDAEELEATRREIEAYGVEAIADDLDVRSTDSIDRLMRRTEVELGAIDILASAAGVSLIQTVAGHPEDKWIDLIDVNLTGAFRAIRAVLPGMIERRWGRIVVIASTAASIGERTSAAYCASKAGLLGLMRCVALEGAPHGVTCNAISPGYVRTGMLMATLERERQLGVTTKSTEDRIAEIAGTYPQNRIIEPEEIGNVAVFLCREEAKGITMEDITVAGGSLW